MHKLMGIILVLTSLMSGYAQAGLVSTQAHLHTSNGQQYTTEQLQTALASEQLQQQLVDMGVEPTQLAERLASLTPAEIQHLNSTIDQQPAGGIIGILLTIFIVFVITDMLCATDIFGFVKCINK